MHPFDFHVFDHISDGAQVLDAEWRYVYINDVAARQGRSTVDALLGRSLLETYPGFEDTPLFAELRACMVERRGTRTLNDFSYPDGERAYFQLRIDPLPDGTILLISTDVTEEAARQVLLDKMRAEIEGLQGERTELVQQLRASEAVLNDFVTYAPAAIAMCDCEMRYLAVSRRWRLDYGLGEQPLIGRSHYELFPDLPESWRRVHQRVLAGGVDIVDEAPFPQPDGTVQWVAWEVRPWQDGSGAIGGLTMFTRDVTHQKQLSLDLMQRSAELERTNRALEGFASAASHDLREPLRGITGCTSLLQRRYGGQLDEGADQLMELIVGSTQRMSQLIDDLLQYARAGEISVGRVDLAQCVDDALERLQVMVEESGARVDVGLLPIVRGDATQLSVLFQNLVSNAIKYAGDGPPLVQIQADARDGAVLVYVRDQGIGIEPVYRHQVFELFQRLHKRDEYSGTGMGLALCRRIAELHGGSIEIGDVDGPGTLFVLTLPEAGP